MVAALIGYLIGSLPLGFLIARGRGGVDLRRVGSGNVGAANVYRSVSRSLGVLVMLVDVAKGASGVLLARLLFPGAGEQAALAGLGAIVGHVYPLWLRFAGGKGVAVACGVFSVLAPLATLSAAVCFVGVTWVTRYVSLGSVLASLTLPAVEWTRAGAGPESLVAAAASVLIVFRHRGNLARIARRTERRLGQRAVVNP
ncbi:MAG: glycerol-3-phosphate 1-O-acyltransferase PlsY [Acidobacteria bacterium]|nr:glycerol-3-phosphate 1-O-acyltransferase PlsY [Acidobacteriota bacterium]